MKTSLKRIRARYILALSLIGGLVTGSVLLMEKVYLAQTKDAEIINTSGMQRMLSQKVSLYVSMLINNKTSQELHLYQSGLRDALILFAKNHERLTSIRSLDKDQTSLSEEIQHLYFGKEVNLDQRVRDFISAAEVILSGEYHEDDLQQFKTQNIERLLNDLNLVVSQFEKEATARVNLTIQASWVLWFLTMVLLLVEGKYIFRPMANKITKVMNRLRNQKALADEYRTRAEQANRIKSQFLSKMSHELRTPMNSISVALQEVEKEPLHPDSKQLVELAQLSCKDLLDIINDLLGITKIDDQSMDLIITPFELDGLIRNVINCYQERIESKQLVVNVSIESVPYKHWLGDRTRLSKLLDCLFSNAIKFTDSGEISVDVFMSDTESVEKLLSFEIKDSGIGISDQVQSRMYERFEQGDNSSRRKYGGVGIGLSIAKHLVEIMQGNLSIESKEGKGTTAKVSIPLIPDKTFNKDVDEEVWNDTLDLSDIDILVAEDNMINQLVIASLLEKMKANVRMTENGQQAVEMFHAFQPDIVLLDIQMPVKDGIDACREIKQKDKTVPVIAVTANVSDEDVAAYNEVGFDGLIAKPIQNEELNRILSHHFPTT